MKVKDMIKNNPGDMKVAFCTEKGSSFLFLGTLEEFANDVQYIDGMLVSRMRRSIAGDEQKLADIREEIKAFKKLFDKTTGKKTGSRLLNRAYSHAIHDFEHDCKVIEERKERTERYLNKYKPLLNREVLEKRRFDPDEGYSAYTIAGIDNGDCWFRTEYEVAIQMYKSNCFDQVNVDDGEELDEAQ